MQPFRTDLRCFYCAPQSCQDCRQPRLSSKDQTHTIIEEEKQILHNRPLAVSKYNCAAVARPTMGRLARSSTRSHLTPYHHTAVANAQPTNHIHTTSDPTSLIMTGNLKRNSPSPILSVSQKKRLRKKNAKMIKNADSSPDSETNSGNESPSHTLSSDDKSENLNLPNVSMELEENTNPMPREILPLPIIVSSAV